MRAMRRIQTFSLNYFRAREVFPQPQWIVYTFDVSGRKRRKDTKRTTLHRNARSGEDLPLDEKILERLVVSPLSQHRRHIFSRILANRVINKVNSAPLVYKRQSSRPKPRSNAPSDVSRLGDL